MLRLVPGGYLEAQLYQSAIGAFNVYTAAGYSRPGPRLLRRASTALLPGAQKRDCRAGRFVPWDDGAYKRPIAFT